MDYREIIALSAHRCLNMEELAMLNAEFEHLASSCKNARSESELAKHELSQLKRRTAISEVAGQYNFTDPEYLEFLTKKEKIEIDDPDAIANFMNSLSVNLPRFFKVDLIPGAGGGLANHPQASPSFNIAAAPPEAKDIAKLLTCAPEII